MGLFRKTTMWGSSNIFPALYPVVTSVDVILYLLVLNHSNYLSKVSQRSNTSSSARLKGFQIILFTQHGNFPYSSNNATTLPPFGCRCSSTLGLSFWNLSNLLKVYNLTEIRHINSILPATKMYRYQWQTPQISTKKRNLSLFFWHSWFGRWC